MKHLLITTIAAVLLVGCGKSQPPDISPIHDAARKGNIEAVKQHIAAGTDVNAKDDKFGWTPLHHAAWNGRTEIAELLIAAGADVNAKDDKFGWTPLHRAALNGRYAIAELLIAKGANVSATDEDGVTPLHTATDRGHIEVVELLITKGADVNVTTDFGITPLDWVISSSKHPETADLLRKHGGKRWCRRFDSCCCKNWKNQSCPTASGCWCGCECEG